MVSVPIIKRRKNTLTSLYSGPVSAAGVEGSSYFSAKATADVPLDTRSRSSTTPGATSTSLFATIPRGSHIIGSTPLVTPRLENIRRDSIRSNAKVLPTTLWDYLILEMENFEVYGVEEYKKERLSNFLQIPESFEKVYQ